MAEHIIKFWGVRGSFPTPDRDKIEVGGHTSCVEIRTADNDLIVLDMGTGLVPLGNSLLQESNPPKSAHVFISHFHWDHIIGYLGFAPFFLKDFTCHIYGKQDKLSIDEIFGHLHNYTFWPVEIPMYQAELNLNTFPENGLKISDSVKISVCKHGHPNGANSYRIDLMNSYLRIRGGDIAAGSNARLFQNKPMLNNWFYIIIVLQMMMKPYGKLRKMPKLYFQTL